MQRDCIRLFRETFTLRHNTLRAKNAHSAKMHLPSLPFFGDVEAASQQMTAYVDGMTSTQRPSEPDCDTGRDADSEDADQSV